MAVVATPPASPLARLVDDYLIHCEARGLAPRTLKNNYGYALYNVFLPWCGSEGITDVQQLDGRTVDRFTSALLRRQRPGKPISKHTVHSYIRPVRQLLTWAAREGEAVRAKPQLPTCQRPLRDVLNREEIDRLEQAAPNERDRLIIRIFGDCGLRLDELTKLAPEDIHRSGRQAYLRVLGKWSRWRDVPLPPQTLRRLDRHIESHPAERAADRIFLSQRRGPDGTYPALTSSPFVSTLTETDRAANTLS